MNLCLPRWQQITAQQLHGAEPQPLPKDTGRSVEEDGTVERIRCLACGPKVFSVMPSDAFRVDLAHPSRPAAGPDPGPTSSRQF